MTPAEANTRENVIRDGDPIVGDPAIDAPDLDGNVTSDTDTGDTVTDTLWRLAGGARATWILLSLLAATLVLSLILTPWIGGFSLHDGDFSGSAGVARLLGGLWQRAIFAALAYNLLLRLATGTRRVLANARRDQTMPFPPRDLVTGLVRATGALADVQQGLEALLDDGGRVIVEQAPTHVRIYAERNRAGWFGRIAPLLAAIGPLVLMLGLLVNDAAGWRADDLALALNDRVAPAQAPELMLALTEMAVEGPGAICTITLTRSDGTSNARRIGRLRPAGWGNIWALQRGVGPALTVSATDDASRALAIQVLASEGGEAGGAPGVGVDTHILFGRTQTEQSFAIPARNLVFRALSYPSLPEQNIDRPVFFVEAFEGEDPAPRISELVETETTVRLPGIYVKLLAGQHIIFSVAYLPGLTVVAAGGLITLLGLVVMWLAARRETWCALAADHQGENWVRIGVSAPIGAARERERLLAAVQVENAPPPGAA